MAPNMGDVATCQRYVACYETNNCNAADSCSTNPDGCGVNKIGGGNLPQTAAEAVYTCAECSCP